MFIYICMYIYFYVCICISLSLSHSHSFSLSLPLSPSFSWSFCFTLSINLKISLSQFFPLYSFPRKNADRLKKDRTRPNRPVRRCTAAVFYPTWRTRGVHYKKRQPSAASSHEARPGKPSFCILCLRTSHTRWGETDNSTLQGLASSWDYILTPARDATQRRGAIPSRRAAVGLDTKGVTRTFTGTKCGQAPDSEAKASRPPP